MQTHRPLGMPGVIPLVGICSIAVGMGAALGFVPGYVSTALQADLDISRAQVGLLISVYFGSTGIGSILGGRLADRYGARLVVASDLALVAGCGALGAWQSRFEILLATSVVAGAGYAWANAGTNLALARHIPPHRRSIAISVKTAGVPAVAGLSALIATPAASRWSWQAVWWSIAAIALVSAIAAWFMLDDDRPIPNRGDSTAALPAGFWWFSLAAFLLVGGSQPLFSWLVPYLEESLGLGPVAAGGIAATAAGAGVAHLVVNGMVDDRRGAAHRMERMAGFSAVAALGTLAVLSGLVLGVVPVALGAVTGLLAQLAAIGTMHSAIVDRAPNAVGRATGVTMTGYYLGALVTPIGFGALVDATGTYAWSWLVVVGMLAAAGPVWLMGRSVPIQLS